MAHTRHVLKDLDLEWAALAASPGASRQLRRWRQSHSCFGAIGSFGELIEAIRHGGFDESNELVWALLELAVEDGLAVRTILQALIPGLGGELGWPLEWARRTDPVCSMRATSINCWWSVRRRIDDNGHGLRFPAAWRIASIAATRRAS